MILLSIIKELGKAFTAICAFFLIGGAYYLIKPTQEDKYLNQQFKMYPLGFHCTNQNDETVVCHFDMESQMDIYPNVKVKKYSMKNALYSGNEKNPFGCEYVYSDNGVQKSVIVYISDSDVDLSTARYEPSDDKDLIYTVVGKSVKKKKDNIRIKM